MNELPTIRFQFNSITTPEIPFDRLAAMPNRLLAVSLIAENQRIKQIRAMLAQKGRVYARIEGTKLSTGQKILVDHQRILYQESDGYSSHIHKLPHGQAHAVFLARSPNFIPVATSDSLWQELSGPRYDTPILREWMPYLETKIRELGHFRECYCYGCHAGTLDITNGVLDGIVAHGIRNGDIAIPPTPFVPLPTGQLPRPIAEITSMEGYLDSYGSILGRKAVDALVPLHRPGIDPLPDLSRIVAHNPERKPYAAQHHVIAGGIGMLEHRKGGFLGGEQGSGKTLMGMISCDEILHKSRRKGGKNGRYRAVVVCPDHLIDKWGREIRETIPGAIVRDFAHWSDILPLTGQHQPRTDPQSPAHWQQAAGPEWYVFGRNQIKWMPEWQSIASSRESLDNEEITPVSRRTVIVKDAAGISKKAIITHCPRCGTVVRDKQRIPIGPDAIGKRKLACTGRYLAPFADPMQPDQIAGTNRVYPLPEAFEEKNVGTEVDHAGKHYIVRQCGEPLWNYTAQPYRWPMARIVHKKLKRFFDSVIIDECHEQKSDSSGQSLASGKFIASTRYALAMTGTLIGGYANHLYPLLYRIDGRSLRAEGFEWGKDLAFSEAYGRVDRIVTTTETLSVDIDSSTKSMRRDIAGKSTERKAVRPGIMPTLFGRHLIANTLFITLAEMAADLPPFQEYVSSPDHASNGKPDPFLFDVVCDMEPDQQTEYDRIESDLKDANTALMQRGSQKLLGAYLWTLLDYPDRPWGWTHPPGFAERFADYCERSNIAHPGLPHTVGWWDGEPGDHAIANWRGVVTPADLPKNIIYPKEQKLLDIVRQQYDHGSQTWIYAQMTNKRDVQPRLAALLHNEGLRVGILRADTVPVREREAWINRNGAKYDVIISHPQLVCTGLELFTKNRHNYSSIIFYQTGYNPFVMGQAARRAWRISQWKPCRVYYLYYRGTMGHKAMKLMSLKAAASRALEGRFTLDGLSALSGDVSIQMALAKGLADSIDDDMMRRSWSKVISPNGQYHPGMVAEYAVQSVSTTGQLFQEADESEEFDF